MASSDFKMAKPKTGANVPNRHIYSRMSFLYQAAAYLNSQPPLHPHVTATTVSRQHTEHLQSTDCFKKDKRTRISLSRRLITDLRSTSKKSQISLTPALKHTICKFCDTLLVEGQSSTTSVENLSKGGKKPWADMLVVACHVCGGIKRYPVHAPRQKRRPVRNEASAEISATGTAAATTDAEALSSAISVGVDST